MKTKTIYLTCPGCKGKGHLILTDIAGNDQAEMQCPRCFGDKRVPIWVPDRDDPAPKKMPGWFRKRPV